MWLDIDSNFLIRSYDYTKSVIIVFIIIEEEEALPREDVEEAPQPRGRCPTTRRKRSSSSSTTA